MIPFAVLIPIAVSALVSAAATFVGRALIGLGVAVFTYTGITASLDFILDKIKGLFDTLPPEMCGIASLLQVDVCITILFSAYAASMALSGLTNGKIKRFGVK